MELNDEARKDISRVIKRDGSIVKFDIERIIKAIIKAAASVGNSSINAEELARMVSVKLALAYASDKKAIPSVEDVQDATENVLMEEGFPDIAKAYILYRHKRKELRDFSKRTIGSIDDLKLSPSQLMIAKSRYLRVDDEGKIETPSEMFRRVARAVAKAEKNYRDKCPDSGRETIEEEFYMLLRDFLFLPGGRILANAGTRLGMLPNCYVLPVEDTMRGVYRALMAKALVQRAGGGTGFSFSRLRMKGGSTSISSSNASGPLAFLKLFNYSSELTAHQGMRKAANLGSLNVEHPDILSFISIKELSELKNFNISVEVTDRFIRAAIRNQKYPLRDPHSGREVSRLNASDILTLIAATAWKSGDPGVLFIDRINAYNPTPELGRIETTDPCGDQTLLPYESSVIGAVNLSLFVNEDNSSKYQQLPLTEYLKSAIKWELLKKTVRLAVRFLDDAIDISKYPLKRIEDTTKQTRKIGLGVMGFADMLFRLRISYNSEDALAVAESVMRFISETALDESVELARCRGPFSAFSPQMHGKIRRNAAITGIAPAGARSLLANTSPSIEPNFSLAYSRKTADGSEIVIVNRAFEEIAKKNGFYSQALVSRILNLSSVKNIYDIPAEFRRVFVTAFDVSPEWHVKMQAAFQKYVDNAISKTVNLPSDATIHDIEKIFLDAYRLGCKGVTVYREGSLSEQVFNLKKN